MGAVSTAFAFERTVGIDYSGASTPDRHLPGLQVYVSPIGGSPARHAPAVHSLGSATGWSRAGVAQWLAEVISGPERVVIGIDHAFSFPASYFEQYELKSWDEFLEDFIAQMPTHSEGATVRAMRSRTRKGEKTDLRLCEKWTSSAKGVFEFDVPGQVAASSHAGIPWLHTLRTECDSRLHFWPFDGWTPRAGKSLVVEVYPSILRNRYAREDRNGDEQDAYAVARWLSELVERGDLDRYLDPPLTEAERHQARLEGWILGIG
jgi:hypothetical protein